uniref:Uncharacterized protein n=1 Tax=Anguilla anguilla TaxID=7936 RepID=A0A0E9XT57_ANGAN
MDTPFLLVFISLISDRRGTLGSREQKEK